MLTNVAGIDIPEVMSSWPVFDSTNMQHLDPLSVERIDDFIIADWMFEAVADQVLPSTIASTHDIENDEDCILIKTPNSTEALPCSRCKLIEPNSPSQIYDLCVSFFHASNWYDLVVESNIRTPKSCFVHIPSNVVPEQDLKVMEELKRAIQSIDGKGKVFARMDHASPKRNVPCRSAQEVIENLNSTERTAAEMRKIGLPRTIMLREYVDDMSEHVEIRCFVHGGVARACNLDVYMPECYSEQDNQFLLGKNSNMNYLEASKTILLSTLATLRVVLRSFLGDIVVATEYHDFVADIALHRSDFEWLVERCYQSSSRGSEPLSGTAQTNSADNSTVIEALKEKLWLIEINTPVYMLATAGNYCLDNKAHQQILFGPLSSVLSYPCMLASIDGLQELLELLY